MSESETLQNELDMIGLTNLPSNAPYAVLTVTSVDEEILGAIARDFDLELSGHSFDPGAKIYRVTCKSRQPGEHKLQAVVLIAATIVANSQCPDGRMRLEFDSDFAEAITEQKNVSVSLPPKEAGVAVSEACQLALAQAGFEFAWVLPEVQLRPEDLKLFKNTFMAQASSKPKRKGA